MRIALGPQRPRVGVLYTDAEGAGGLGAVFFIEDRAFWFEDSAPLAFYQGLEIRKTQIIPLEALAVLSAIMKFGNMIVGGRILVFVDNQSVLGALRKGSSPSQDLLRIVGAVWDEANRLNIQAIFLWVPSALNIADFPSRASDPQIPGSSKVQLGGILAEVSEQLMSKGLGRRPTIGEQASVATDSGL